MKRVGWIVAAYFLAACEQVTGAPVVPSSEAPNAPDARDMQVVTDAQAKNANLAEDDLSIDFTEGDTDGTHMLSAWLGEARSRGAHRVGTIDLYIVRAVDDGTTECRTSFYPENVTVPETVGGGTTLESVMQPVSRMVTRFVQRCQLVSKPVMRTETTYQMQYDFFTKSTRSVPQTRMVTDYRMENQCHTETVLETEMHWEYTPKWRYVPPHVEWLSENKLRETKPACTAVDAEAHVSRVEGKIYVPRPPGVHAAPAAQDAPAAHDTSACKRAYSRIDELAQAWANGYGGQPQPQPSRMEFLAICAALSEDQQICLEMPYAKGHPEECGREIEALPKRLHDRLDRVLLRPEN